MSLEDLVKRTAARKAAGADQTYPAHTPGEKSAPVRGLSLVPPSCVHLGARVPGEPCGSPLLRCLKFGDVTTRLTHCSGASRCCKTCGDYEAKA